MTHTVSVWSYRPEKFEASLAKQVSCDCLRLETESPLFGRQGLSPPIPPAERTASRNLLGLKSWPTDALRAINGVEVEFIAGYGVGADVPAPIREALLLCVGDMHNNREGPAARREKVGESEIERFSPSEIPLPAKQLLQTYKVWKL